ncbi:MAG TPA: hypothetical protein VIC62_02855, partial [Nakamurella sp.]
LILRQFLAPVPPFGPDRQGWPMGRLVRRAELEAVAVQVDGVDYVQGLVLGTLDSVDQATQVDLVTLERWQVPDLAEIAVVSGDPLDLGAVYAPPPPPRVPVPVPPDVC